MSKLSDDTSDAGWKTDPQWTLVVEHITDSNAKLDEVSRRLQSLGHNLANEYAEQREALNRVSASLVQVKREKDQRIVELIQQKEAQREQITTLELAAAEQREQWDAERLVVDVITQKQQEQIATLTAEQRADVARWTAANNEAQALIATLTAERDEARHERELLRVKLAQTQFKLAKT